MTREPPPSLWRTDWYANDAVASTDLTKHLLTAKIERGMRVAVCGARCRRWRPAERFACPEVFRECEGCNGSITHEYDIGGTRVVVDHRWRVVRTTFPDGTHVLAAPNRSGEDVARALALGYRGDDPSWAMTAEHDLTHVALAHCQGLPHSPMLYAVAHGLNLPQREVDAEEAEVLRVQRVMNLVRGGGHPTNDRRRP